MRGAFALGALLATPAVGQSELTFADIGNLFCAALTSGDSISPGPLLTSDLAALTGVATRDGTAGTGRQSSVSRWVRAERRTFPKPCCS